MLTPLIRWPNSLCHYSGSDTVENAIALCPNCHREMHYGINKSTLVSSMYNKLTRLVVE
ncbi:MAG: HNH endonuclease [Halomonadaceae bacterium]|uniref:HNH endonuclease n=1 Tax=Halomonas colorata TaxID=2742615 RepID=UPI00399D649F